MVSILSLNILYMYANNIYCYILFAINFIDYICGSGTAHLIHTMCAFEVAWNQSTVSPWCKIFSLDDFRVR